MEARGKGQFYFNNRVGTEVNARFVLPTDPPGTSSLGEGFQVQLLGGPEGTPAQQLKPLDPPSTVFRTSSLLTGYVVGVTVTIPDASISGYGTVLVRVFNGSSWNAASYQFERLYPKVLLKGDVPPPNLQMGTSPLVLQLVPETSPLLLALFGFGALVCRCWVSNNRVEQNRPAPRFRSRPSHFPRDGASVGAPSAAVAHPKRSPPDPARR
jgi:hypothetical protein